MLTFSTSRHILRRYDHGAWSEVEGTKVGTVLHVWEIERMDVGQGMYSLTRLLVKRDISL